MAALLTKSRSLPRDATIASEAELHVAAGARLSAVEQLEIYREQFWLRHTASLLEDFPGLSGILGQADWERLVESYLAVVVPTSWTLRDLGYRLPEHVERATWLPHHELAVDMARLEWAYVELFDERDTPPIDAEKIASIPEPAWETARIVLTPALALLSVRYPVATLREELRAGAFTVGATSALPEPRADRLVLYRDRDGNVAHASVSQGAFELLRELKAGSSLSEAAERAAIASETSASEIEAKVGEWFEDFGVRGWVVDVETT